jgi:hypothetical protein
MSEETSRNVENSNKFRGEPVSAHLTAVWSDRGRPVFAEEGKPWKGFGAIGDITKRRRAEAALRENETRLTAKNTALAKLNELSSRLWHSQSLRKGPWNTATSLKTFECLTCQHGCS